MAEYDFYALFDIPRNATSEQIQKSYKTLISIYHSDKTGNGDDNMVKLINHAKDVLLNPNKRRSHDLVLSFINSVSNNSQPNNSASIKEIENLKTLIVGYKKEIERIGNQIAVNNHEIKRLNLLLDIYKDSNYDLKDIEKNNSRLNSVIYQKDREIESLRSKLNLAIRNNFSLNNTISELNKKLSTLETPPTNSNTQAATPSNMGEGKTTNDGCIVFLVLFGILFIVFSLITGMWFGVVLIIIVAMLVAIFNK